MLKQGMMHPIMKKNSLVHTYGKNLKSHWTNEAWSFWKNDNKICLIKVRSKTNAIKIQKDKYKSKHSQRQKVWESQY